MGEIDAVSAMVSLHASTITAVVAGSPGSVKVEGSNSFQFPAGLRVLVVDDDPICLLILDRMLRRCLYQVTTCGQATTALALLREKRDKFDLVISDVCMPDMDGFRLLELVGLETDLPVIMMSANGETSAVMKGVTHGACDYLTKPVRIEELRNIWQHVVRKKWRDSDQSGGEDLKHKRISEDGDLNASGNDGLEGSWKHSKKRKDVKEEEEDADQESEDPSTTKKPRVVWSMELHQQFVSAVNQLGIDKAVPKRILELMNSQGLTRENVASHLQKYRLYLKRTSGVGHQSGNLNFPFAGASDSSFGAVSGGGHDLRALAAFSQLGPQALVSSLQAGLFGRLNPSSNPGMAAVDPSLLMHIAALQSVNSSALVKPPYGQPLLSSQGNLHQGTSSGPDLRQFAQGPLQAFGQAGANLDKASAGILALQQQISTAGGFGGMGQLVGLSSNVPMNSNDNALMMQILQQQAGAQLTSGGGLNFPVGALLEQHLLPNEVGARATPLLTVSNQSTSTGYGVGVSPSVGGQVRPEQGSPLSVATSSSSNMLNSLVRSSGTENKGMFLSSAGNASISLPCGRSVSSPLTINGDTVCIGMKGWGATDAGVNENAQQHFRGQGSNITFAAGKHGPGPRQGWQGLSFNQEFEQTSSPVLSPRFSQASSNNHGLNVGCRQEQGQFRAPGSAGQIALLSSSVGVDGGFLKPPMSNTQSHCAHLAADNEPKVKEVGLDLLMGSKAENTSLAGTFYSSDELFNMFLKQQQEGAGFTEADFTADGYALDHMYVK